MGKLNATVRLVFSIILSITVLVVAQTASISGGVRNLNTSAAIGGATVTLVQGGTAAYTTTSASNGTYSFTNVSPGTYTLTGTMTGYTTWTQSKTLASGNVLTGQNIAMTPAAVINASISGGVRNINTSTAIGGATVTLVQGGTAAYTTTSASNGTYSFTNVTPGTYTLTGTMTGYTTWTQSKTLASGDALTGQNIAMTPVAVVNATISGGVRDANSNAAIGGATVTLVQGGTAAYTTTSASNGTYSFTNVTPGTYTLTGTMTGYTTWTQSKTLASGDALTGQNIAMTPVAVVNATISGGVRDANSNAAIGGATVTLVQGGTAAYTTTSASNGTYSFTNVTPGTYTLTGTMTGYTTWTQSKTLASGDALTGQNIAMTPVAVVNATISGGVRDANSNAAIGGATVTLVQGGTAAYTTTSASNGTYSFTNVTPGTYTLTGTMTGYTTWTQSKTLASGDALTGQNIAMTPVAVVNATISGGVRDANSNAAIGGATVTLVQGGTAAYTTTSASNGTYSFTNVTPGTYTLTGTMTGYTTWTQSKTLASGDALTGQNIAMTPMLPANKVLGIDVSSGTPDWQQFKASGGVFGIVRATLGTTPSNPPSNTIFKNNMVAGTNAGIIMGAYDFAYPTINTPEAEAQYFLQVTNSYNKMPPFLDMENDDNYPSKPLEVLGSASLSAWIMKWVNAVKQSTHINPILYCDGDYAKHLYPYLKDSVKLWIATNDPIKDPMGSPDKTGWETWTWVIHQYAPNVTMYGSLVDQDVFSGTIDQFNAFIQLPTQTIAASIARSISNLSISQEHRNEDFTFLRYTIPEDGPVNITIYNMAGKNIQELAMGVQTIGQHTIALGTNQTMQNMSSGFYLAKIVSNKKSAMGKIQIVK